LFDDIFFEEHPEKNGWWLNELESIGVDTKDNSDELNDKQNKGNLVESIKQSFIEEYEQVYSKKKT
jgi:hypothetical protein